MTVEELKAEANKLGYNILKKPEYIKLLPCTCGSVKRKIWYRYSRGEETKYYECLHCGKKSTPGATNNEAKQNWNNMIEAERDNVK